MSGNWWEGGLPPRPSGRSSGAPAGRAITRRRPGTSRSLTRWIARLVTPNAARGRIPTAAPAHAVAAMTGRWSIAAIAPHASASGAAPAAGPSTPRPRRPRAAGGGGPASRSRSCAAPPGVAPPLDRPANSSATARSCSTSDAASETRPSAAGAGSPWMAPRWRPTSRARTRGKEGRPRPDPDDPPRRRANPPPGPGRRDNGRPPVRGGGPRARAGPSDRRRALRRRAVAEGRAAGDPADGEGQYR